MAKKPMALERQRFPKIVGCHSKAVCFGIGLVVIGLGTATYLHTNVAPFTVDRLTLIIQELTRTRCRMDRLFRRDDTKQQLTKSIQMKNPAILCKKITGFLHSNIKIKL